MDETGNAVSSGENYRDRAVRRSIVAETAGAVTVSGRPLTAEEERAATEIAIAEDVMNRMGG